MNLLLTVLALECAYHTPVPLAKVTISQIIPICSKQLFQAAAEHEETIQNSLQSDVLGRRV